MKTLHLLRHTKSERSDASFDDFARRSAEEGNGHER
jgi:phosphohistidine phosphatase SixA